MTKDWIASAICTILFGVLVALVGRDWLVSAFSTDPVAAICFTLCAASLGYLACSLVHVGRQSQVDELSDEVRRLRSELAELRSGRGAKLRALATRIDKLPLGEKMFVAWAYDGRDMKMEGLSADAFFKYSAPQLEGIAYAVQHEMGVLHVRLEEEARDAIDAHPECLDSARGTMAKRAKHS